MRLNLFGEYLRHVCKASQGNAHRDPFYEPANIFPDKGAGPTDLDFPPQAWVTAVDMCEPGARGKSGIMIVAVKQLTTLSLSTLHEVVQR